MTKHFINLILIVLFSVAGTQAFAQGNSNGNGNGGGNGYANGRDDNGNGNGNGMGKTATDYAYGKTYITMGLQITKTQDIQFGQIVRSTTAGTIVLDPTTANRAVSGGVVLGQTTGGTAARFTATGEPGYTYTLTLPSSATITKAVQSGAAPSMTITNFTSSLGASRVGILSAEGTQTFNVGGTLNVGASQEPGEYNGQFNVIVTYQ